MIGLPTGKRWEKAYHLWVQFHDEAPNIGSGWRLVWVLEGRKWCYLATHHGRQRIKMGIWSDIKKSGTYLR